MVPIVPDVMVDETAEGDVYAALRMREADLDKHLSVDKADESVALAAREKAREEARKRLEEDSKKPPEERRLPEFGSEKDFQLQQALNQLKGKPVLVSKTLTERKPEPKDDDAQDDGAAAE
jgi:carboxyl-terminal processing protease